MKIKLRNPPIYLSYPSPVHRFNIKNAQDSRSRTIADPLILLCRDVANETLLLSTGFTAIGLFKSGRFLAGGIVGIPMTAVKWDKDREK